LAIELVCQLMDAPVIVMPDAPTPEMESDEGVT
jgi:hypothetical protein